MSALALAVLAHSSLYLTRSYFSDGNKHHHIHNKAKAHITTVVLYMLGYIHYSTYSTVALSTKYYCSISITVVASASIASTSATVTLTLALL